ncbi:MAG: enoyl-CoA hydratase/isomerase family protein, partial [Candidatus Dormibacteria bacterium]
MSPQDQAAPGVRLERDGRVARVAVGTGARRNALTSAGWAGVERMFRELAGHEQLRAVVLHGAGGTFSAGSDMREWAEADPAGVEESFARMEAACAAIEALPVPVIAQVAGAAAGAGCQLALACDLQVMA